ncbi:protein NEGATIVE REGULATOR OF RESISTANCE-like [Salvia miltiorrhiza]|uniref:protein NEGATIVE REGULATOR OF RESISTANCE-like n=1 Tax=Salvia miltiorrhiza TaxID=226208 RepID=UPI0025AD4FF4|nr:protein NEGATIVE REGULATOR OF RESISTANCE-like [Salvia miltiorrhiza]
MDGEKKKRKMDESGAHDEAEEEKMEKFFALIKSTREVRERLVGAPENRERAAADKRQPPPWNPTFVLEDFVETPSAPAPAPEVEKEGTSAEGEKPEKSDEKGFDLDLNLSL